jgi:hypothetical protein
VYTLEGTKTNKVLSLLVPGRTDFIVRTYRMEFVSNSEFTRREYDYLNSDLLKFGRRLPSAGTITKKAAELGPCHITSIITSRAGRAGQELRVHH